MKNQNKAFTLVELIVVITILAILGTIAFISLQGYSSQARDSKRITDIGNIKTSLELFTINTGKYPLPDDKQEVTYSGETMWYQGIIGNTVTTNLSRNLNKKPTDPLTEQEYTYSTINSQTQYELLSVYESDLVSYGSSSIRFNGKNLGGVTQTNAANANYPKISGNYNGIFVKTQTYYIPTPSIINAEVNGAELILNNDNIKSQIITGGANKLPNGIIETSTGGLTLFTLQVFSGVISSGNDDNKEALANKLILAYSGTTLANNGVYKQIVETSGTNNLIVLINDIVLNGKKYISTLGGIELIPVQGGLVSHFTMDNILSYTVQTTPSPDDINFVTARGKPIYSDIIFVGSDGSYDWDYSNPRLAIEAAQDGNLILIYTGSYDLGASTGPQRGNSLYVRGMGNNVNDVYLTTSTSVRHTMRLSIPDFEYIIENMKISDPKSRAGAFVHRECNEYTNTYLNKLNLIASNSGCPIYFGDSIANSVYKGNSYVTNSNMDRGYRTFREIGRGSSTSIISVEKSQYYDSYSCRDCVRNSIPHDYVTTSTNGYGYNYGENLIKFGGEALIDEFNTNTGGIIGAEIGVTGKVLNALKLDGIDDYVNIGTMVGTGSKSLSFWINYNNILTKQIFGSYDSIAGTPNRFYFGINDIVGKYSIGVGNNINNTLSHNLSVGEWYNFIITYDGTNTKLYKDGLEILSFVSIEPNTIAKNFIIGGLDVKGKISNFTNAKIDQLLYYNKTLSASEVLELYNFNN